MSIRWVVAGLALACATVFNIWLGIVTWEMVDKVNERLPQDQQFSHFGWSWAKYRRLDVAYAAYYPDGQRRQRSRKVFLIACLFMIVCAFALFSG